VKVLQSRRQFLRGSLSLGALSFLVGCGILPSQARPAKIARIGLLSSGSAAASPFLDAFHQGLLALGYVEGQNISLDYRYAEGGADRLQELASELIQLKVDVVLAASSRAARAVKEATSVTPIVAVGMSSDPVATGLVESLARPGGNLTGVFVDLPELSGKLLELLKEGAPGISQVVVLWEPADPGHATLLREVELAGRSLGVQLQSIALDSPDDIDRLSTAVTISGVGGLIVFSSTTLNAQRARIADLAANKGLPAISPIGGFAAAGGLMSYGPNFADMYRRAATYVDKILKGTKPADLPVERPITFDFIVNLKTAQALGLTMPQSIVQQATEVIR
jgi:putative ABC transport system substrate-binding protein